jgi:hypothetical protein
MDASDQHCVNDATPSGLFEQLDDSVRHANELVERWNDWLAWEKRTFVERYLSGHTKIGIRRVDVGPPYRGAIFEALPQARHAKALGPGFWINDDVVRPEVDPDEPFVFSCDVHLMEGVEQIVPSRVRLQTFNDYAVNVTEPLFSFGFGQRINEIGVTGIDRKVMVGSRRYAFATRQRSGQEIQARPCAIDYCPNTSVEVGWKAMLYLQLKELLPRLRARLFEQQVWGHVEPGFESLLEGWEMGSGPVNGPVGVLKVVAHG